MRTRVVDDEGRPITGDWCDLAVLPRQGDLLAVSGVGRRVTEVIHQLAGDEHAVIVVCEQAVSVRSGA